MKTLAEALEMALRKMRLRGGVAPTYEPELGQMMFGQPWKPHAVPPVWEAALVLLDDELERVMGNITQEPWDSPFGNTGNRFECPAFAVHAYSWGEDEQPWNFKWRDVEIGWYKGYRRGLSSNVPLTPDLAAAMLEECLEALRRMEEEHERKGRADG